MLIKTYQKYLTKTFISLLLQITFVFFSLIIILSLFEEISYFKDLDTNFFYPIFLTFLNSPSIVYNIFPFIFLISTIFFFIKISEKNELNIYHFLIFSYSLFYSIHLVRSYVSRAYRKNFIFVNN